MRPLRTWIAGAVRISDGIDERGEVPASPFRRRAGLGQVDAGVVERMEAITNLPPSSDQSCGATTIEPGSST